MATISITVGPVTVTKQAPDDKAQEVFERVYERIVGPTPDNPTPTAKQKLAAILQETVSQWIEVAGEVDVSAEREVYMRKLAELHAARQAAREAWK